MNAQPQDQKQVDPTAQPEKTAGQRWAAEYDVPESWREQYVAVVDGSQVNSRGDLPSPRQAIKTHCGMCMGWHRPSVKDCPSRGCPLWRFRPFQG